MRGRGSSDYARVERVIEAIVMRADEQPTLTELADVAGLSPFHFQRLFQRWAGVTPKTFVQFVTIERAKEMLRASVSVLDASHAVGLSGAGRLHDLFVNIERMTPGEFKREAAGITLRHGVHSTPFGEALFVASERGLSSLSFLRGKGSDEARAIVRADWAGARWVRDPAFTEPFARELETRVRDGSRKPIALLLKGTPFQLKVWEALLRVPEGAVTTYGALATEVCAAPAARAVGAAVGANPIAALIPCHRVIRASGALGGYRWGEVRKTGMLARELARSAR